MLQIKPVGLVATESRLKALRNAAWFCGADPRSAADALVGFLGVIDLRKSRTGGPARIRGSAPRWV